MCFPPYSVLYVPIITIILLLLPLCMPIVSKHRIATRNFVEALIYFSTWVLIYGISVLINKRAPTNSLLLFMLYGTSFLLMRDSIKQMTFRIFVRVFAVLLALGIIEYLFFLQGLYIPIGIATREITVGEYDLLQCLFNFFSLFDEGFTRFQSLAEEPGLIGTLCALLLFVIDRKEFRFSFWIFIIAGMLTLSLAFFVLLLLYIISQMRSAKGMISALVCSLVLVATIQFFEDTEGVQHFMGRLEMKENADNRTSDQFDRHLTEMMNSSHVWLGEGYGAISDLHISDGGNAGAKVLFYHIGVVGILLLLVTYTYLIFRKKGINAVSIFFLIAFWASFYQRETITVPYYIIVFFTPLLTQNKPVVSPKKSYISNENHRNHTAVEFGRR